MGVVEESINSRSRQGFGHDSVETGGMQIAGDGQASLPVRCVDHELESFSGLLAGGQVVQNEDAALFSATQRDPVPCMEDKITEPLTGDKIPELQHAIQPTLTRW